MNSKNPPLMGTILPSTPTSVNRNASNNASLLTSSELISMIKMGPSQNEPTATANKAQVKKEVTSVPFQDDYKLGGLAAKIRFSQSHPSSLILGLDSEATLNALLAAATAPLAESFPPSSSTSAPPSSSKNDKPLICKSFSSPWSEPAGTWPVGGLESILPECYNVQAPPPAASRMSSFAEETLFYMFYAMPKDRMQDLAARELTVNRGWRYHRELQIWILIGSAAPTTSGMTAGISSLRMSPSSPTSASSNSLSDHQLPPGIIDASLMSYVMFDPTTWTKVRKEFPLLHDSLFEDRFTQQTTPTAPVK